MKQDFRCGRWLLEKTETAMKVITRNLDRGIWRVMIGSANQTAMAYWKPIKKKKPKSHNDLGFMFGGSVVRQINVRECQKLFIFTINKQYVVKILCSRTSCYIRKNLTFYAVPYAWRFV